MTEAQVLEPKDIVAAPEKVRKITILGFADSRVNAPYADLTWEIWGCNDVYAHVPRVDVTFEVHHLMGLGNRRNPQHEQWLRSGKMPVWMTQAHPEFPTSRPVPYDVLLQKFPRGYFTSSIAVMLAMAILEIKNEAPWSEEKWDRGEIALFGIDMSHSTERMSQKPCVEYYVGVADGLGIPLFVPENCDLCKSNVVYGLGTTAPLAIRLQSKEEHLRAEKIKVLQTQAQKQAEVQALEAQLNAIRGQMAMAEYVKNIWTYPTDVPAKDLEERLAGLPESLQEAVAKSDGQVDVPVLIQEGVS